MSSQSRPTIYILLSRQALRMKAVSSVGVTGITSARLLHQTNWRKWITELSRVPFPCTEAKTNSLAFCEVQDLKDTVRSSRAGVAQSVERLSGLTLWAAAAWYIPVSSPTNACSQVHGREWLDCHACHQEVGRCGTRGEFPGTCTTYTSTKVAHSGFETQRRRHQKSKTEVSMAPQKGLVSLPKNFKKRIQSDL